MKHILCGTVAIITLAVGGAAPAAAQEADWLSQRERLIRSASKLDQMIAQVKRIEQETGTQAQPSKKDKEAREQLEKMLEQERALVQRERALREQAQKAAQKALRAAEAARAEAEQAERLLRTQLDEAERALRQQRFVNRALSDALRAASESSGAEKTPLLLPKQR